MPNSSMAFEVKPRSFQENGLLIHPIVQLAHRLTAACCPAPGRFHVGLTPGGGTKQFCGVRPATCRPGRRARLLREAHVSDCCWPAGLIAACSSLWVSPGFPLNGQRKPPLVGLLVRVLLLCAGRYWADKGLLGSKDRT